MKSELPDRFNDKRGYIQPISHDHKGSVVVIDTVPFVQRANHYHKEDYHYCYVISGKIHYYERPANTNIIPIETIYTAGEMFYTGPMMEHCMYFDVPTTFLTLGGKTRMQEDYEADLVRTESLREIFINHEKASQAE